MALLALACAIVLAALGALVWQHTGPTPLEHRITSGVISRTADPPQLDAYEPERIPFAIAIQPGEPFPFIAALFGLLYLGSAAGSKRLMLVCAGGPAAAVFATDYILKPFIHRTAHGGEGLAYPSGHSAAAAALAAALFVYLRHQHGVTTARRALPLLALVPLAMGLSVVFLRWHFIFDVPGGFAIGVGSVMLAAALFLRPPVPR